MLDILEFMHLGPIMDFMELMNFSADICFLGIHLWANVEFLGFMDFRAMLDFMDFWDILNSFDFTDFMDFWDVLDLSDFIEFMDYFINQFSSFGF